MNEKNNNFKLYIFIFLCGMFIGGLTIACGCYFFITRPDRTLNRQLTEKLESARNEAEQYRKELADTNRELQQSIDKLQSVREELRESIDTVQSSYTDLSTIRAASQTIREQVKILSDYYTNTCNLYNSICDNNDNSSQKKVDK